MVKRVDHRLHRTDERQKLEGFTNTASLESRIMETTPYRTVPDFGNLGTHLRVAILAEAARVVYVVMASDNVYGAAERFIEQGLAYEPTLFISLLLLYALSRWINSMRPQLALLVQFFCVNVVCLAVVWAVAAFVEKAGWFFLFKALALTNLMCVLFVAYFEWRHLRLSPNVAGAQLLALQARIQPHFLFNSLNSVLSLMRIDVPKAEKMLEDLSDLFRALISDARTLVPLSDELALAKSYVSIEEIRYGARLKVLWHIDEQLGNFRIPPFILQPLVENAINHGIGLLEPVAPIEVVVEQADEQLLIRVTNPRAEQQGERKGSGSALENIRQRLAYHFDVEAQISTKATNESFVAEVRIPERSTALQGKH